MLDIFNNSAFSLVEMTDRVNKMPFAPMRIGQMGLFVARPVRTPIVGIEEMNGVLSLIPTTPRGGPGYENATAKRKVRDFRVPHLELNDTVMADEVSGVRAFGTDDELAGVQTVVDQRVAEMTAKHDATLEYGRIGAIKGTILDADGTTTIYNLFTEFGVTQTAVDFLLGTATTDIRGKIIAVKRAIEDELGAATYQRIHCFAGSTWFDRFIAHADVKAAFERWRDGEQLRGDLRFTGFEFAGVVFEEYRGRVGSVDYVAASEAHFFPVGVPDLFRTYYAPADWIETVNQLGLPRYAKQVEDRDGKGRRVLTQSNPLSICTRPKTLVKGITSN